MFYLGEPTLVISSSNNGANCCTFLALKIAETWHLKIKSIESAIFKRCLEAKFKIFTLSDKCVSYIKQ